MNAYALAKKVFESRRNGFRHRRLSSVYCVSDRFKDGTLTLESVWNYNNSKLVDKPTDPFAIIYPDGSFRLEPSLAPGHAAYRAIGWLTKGTLALRCNTSIKIRATGIITRAVHWEKDSGWYVAGEEAVKSENDFSHYADALKRAKECGFPFLGGVIIRSPYSPLNCTSLEPVLMRKWDPEKRKTYLKLFHHLRNQSELRIRMGALANVDLGRSHQLRDQLKKSLGLDPSEDGNHQPAYTAIISAAIPFLPWAARRALYSSNGGGISAVDTEDLLDAVMRLLNSSREDLRRNTGAVIYS